MVWTDRSWWSRKSWQKQWKNTSEPQTGGGAERGEGWGVINTGKTGIRTRGGWFGWGVARAGLTTASSQLRLVFLFQLNKNLVFVHYFRRGASRHLQKSIENRLGSWTQIFFKAAKKGKSFSYSVFPLMFERPCKASSRLLKTIHIQNVSGSEYKCFPRPQRKLIMISSENLPSMVQKHCQTTPIHL